MDDKTFNPAGKTLISMSGTRKKLGGVSRQYVYDRMRDPGFPKPVRPSGPFSPLYFFEHELDAWLSALPRVELDGLNAVERRQAA